MNLLVLLAVFIFGALFGFLFGYVWKSDEAKTVILERGPDGETRLVSADGPAKWPAHVGPPLRPYDVGPDGVVEFSDGERVDPDVTIIKPPDMRILE